MSRLARCRILIAAPLIVAATAPFLMAADGAIASRPSTSTSYIIVGFAGGFVRHDNRTTAQCDLRNGFGRAFRKATQSRSLKTGIEKCLQKHSGPGSNHDGVLSDQEKSHAHIILFGHSWGASAVVLLSRELDREKSPSCSRYRSIASKSPGKTIRPSPTTSPRRRTFISRIFPWPRIDYGRRRFEDSDSGQLPFRLPEKTAVVYRGILVSTDLHSEPHAERMLSPPVVPGRRPRAPANRASTRHRRRDSVAANLFCFCVLRALLGVLCG